MAELTPAAEPEGTVNKTEVGSEVALDGVYYAQWQNWRIASLNPAWRQDIALLPANPDKEALAALTNTWLKPDKNAQPIAVMCCGLGSAWPGMGRELYDNFPVCRAAMDQIASYADWDILALMDEQDISVLNDLRKQIPYLFMYEYAQWSQLVSLGFQPSLVCGHSLGELIALCVAGVYDGRSAWRLFDVHASHLADVAAKMADKKGMLAISADSSIISGLLAEHPDLYISNQNTPRQYILSGSLDLLKDIRKQLRRQRIPAFLLNMGLAFHNPRMCMLRDLSYNMLMNLEMHPPAVPALSCVTIGPYPDDQPSICRYITNLEENTVRWEELTHAIRAKYGIKTFLELGPQETLCGLARELEPDTLCLPACAKNHETLAMRKLCARLFSLGYLPLATIKNQKSQRTFINQSEANNHKQENPVVNINIDQNDLAIILGILARECGREPGQISLDMDLRYDLGLRSIRFPYLLQEAERLLQRPVDLEHLFQISTVGDLAAFLAGNKQRPEKQTAKEESFDSPFYAPPLRRFAIEDDSFKPVYINPDNIVMELEPGDAIILCIFDSVSLTQLWAGLAPMGCLLVIPQDQLTRCGKLRKAGCQIIGLPINENSSADEILQAFIDQDINPKGILLAGPEIESAWQQNAAFYEKFLTAIKNFYQRLPATKQGFLCIVQRINATGQTNLAELREHALQFNDALLINLVAENCRLKIITWLDSRQNPTVLNVDEAGDMLALELLYGPEPFVLWETVKENLYCPSSSWLNYIYAEPLIPARASLFQGACQFSRFGDPAFAQHGKEPPSLPFCAILNAMWQCARILVPWLQPAGFEDIIIHNFPPLPAGITRECRISAKAIPWILQNGLMARLCHIDLSMRSISENGRRLDIYEPLCDGQCLFTAQIKPLRRLWTQDWQTNFANGNAERLNKFYEHLDYGPAWRLLTDLEKAGEIEGKPAYEAMINAEKCAAAAINKWSYVQIFYMVESIIQAAMFILSQNGEACQWRCSGFGYLLFDINCLHSGDCRLQLRQSLRDEKITRFDAQICYADGSVLLTLLHLEFIQ